MKLMGFGKSLSGKLLFQPMEEEEAAKQIVDRMQLHAASMRMLTNTAAHGETFRGEAKRQMLDIADPTVVGWTYLVSSKDPRHDEIIRILQPLAQRRGMADPAAPLVFGDVAESDFPDWLQDNLLVLPLAGKSVPHYVLFVGSPLLLPFSLQWMMNTVCNTGRLDFDSLEGLEAYVDKVIRLEEAAGPVVSRSAVVFGTDGGISDPTYFSRKYMVDPLAKHIVDKLEVPTKTLVGKEATKENFVTALRDASPALVYTASHGLGALDEPLETQKRYNGSICCQTDRALSPNDLFSSDDVPSSEPFLEGAIVVQFACYGGGTPATSDYAHWLGETPKQSSKIDFVASLPKTLLAHPRGPIAYIGHLDTAFLHGFTDPDAPHARQHWNARMAPFVQIVSALLTLQPAGLSMVDMSRRVRAYNTMLTSVFDRLQRGKFASKEEAGERLLDAWIMRSDAQNYFVLGDPAARLRIPE